MTAVWSEQSRSHSYKHTERWCRRCCCSVCCYAAVVAAAVVLFLLLFVIVPDGKKLLLVNLIPVFSCPSFKLDLFLMYPSAVLSHVPPRFAYILGNHGRTRSQGGHQPAVAKPPTYSI